MPRKWYAMPAYDEAAHRKLDAILTALQRHGGTTMAELSTILDAVRQQTTVIDSVHALLERLRAEQDPAARQQILDELIANTTRLDQALVENTGGEVGA